MQPTSKSATRRSSSLDLPANMGPTMSCMPGRKRLCLARCAESGGLPLLMAARCSHVEGCWTLLSACWCICCRDGAMAAVHVTVPAQWHRWIAK